MLPLAALPAQPLLGLLFPAQAGDLLDLQSLADRLESAGQLRYARLPHFPCGGGSELPVFEWMRAAPQQAVLQGGGATWVVGIHEHETSNGLGGKRGFTAQQLAPRSGAAHAAGSPSLFDWQCQLGGIAAAWQQGRHAYLLVPDNIPTRIAFMRLHLPPVPAGSPACEVVQTMGEAHCAAACCANLAADC